MALAHAIMTALLEDELSGYELARAFDASLGVFWQASHQQIYRELHKLEQQGLLNSREIAQRGRPPRIAYRLSRKGQTALADWVFAESRVQPAKDELLVKLCNVGPHNVQHLAAEIASRREQTMRRMYFFEKIRRWHYAEPAALPDRRKGVYLTLQAGIGRGEQFLQWCDEALELLRTIPPQP